MPNRIRNSQLSWYALMVCGLSLGACQKHSPTDAPLPTGKERLSARPHNPASSLAPGIYQLPVIGAPACCSLQVPSSVTSKQPLPLLVMLHGAGGTPEQVDKMLALGEEYGYAVLAPKSTRATWDAAIDGFGADVTMIDAALAETFTRINVDPKRIALAGFSDGASYALSLGLANGDLFTHIIAFSPGFMTPVPRVGKPVFFMAHGAQDGATSAQTTQTLFVPFLRTLGYTVRFDSFQGGHRIDDTEARLASEWFLER